MLAIVIPYYKITFFEETLQSLANQTDKRFKVYIGDDASPENLVDLLEKFKGTFDFIYNRFESNLGGIALTKQWERCIALSGDEEWIMILGDDDYLSDNVVETFYKHHRLFKEKVNVVRFASRIDRHKQGIFSITYKHPVWEKASNSYYRKYKNLTMSSLSEYVFTRNSYNTFGFRNFPLAWYSDDMAWLQFSDSKLIYSINDVVVYFRYSENNISGKQDNMIEKERAQYLFFKNLINEQLFQFNLAQRKVLLLEFGIIAIKLNLLNLKNSSYIAIKLVMNGSIYAFVKFIRRVLIAKFK